MATCSPFVNPCELAVTVTVVETRVMFVMVLLTTAEESWMVEAMPVIRSPPVLVPET